MSAREKISLQYISILNYSFADLILKIITNNYVNTNIFSMLFFQSISLIIFTFCDIKNYGFTYPNFKEYKKLVFIIIRGLSNCSINIFITLATYHIKYAIIITILFSNGIIISIFSLFYLKEKFYFRFLFGFILSFLGLYLFAFSEGKNDQNVLLNQNSNTTKGLFFASMASLSISILIIMNQNLKEIHPCILNYFCGWIGLIVSFPYLFYLINFETASGYIFMNVLNSLFFHMGSSFHSISMIYNSLILISTVSFSSIILAFIYGLLFFGEKLILSELIGIFSIISYNIYNIYYPIDQIKKYDLDYLIEKKKINLDKIYNNDNF